MHGNVPVRFGRGRLDFLVPKEPAAYLIATRQSVRARTVKRICKHHDIDPVAYLQDILGRQPSQPTDQLEGLLPDVWFTSHPRARRQPAA